ncbi:hypothetical protein [uncultured Ruminococcus sp.]|uniref:hypothetical protein n=1 Tax=uncultured Ruminococcus sp. TaxID=165186 RepID=UPI00266625E6|nr:hypothetical protein [uncultured Ruminococcus sp.]
MTKEKYQKEIKLIQAQNNTEIELYPLATEIIQTATEGLSKRYVFGRKKSKKGNVYYGLSSFPDIAILDKDFKDTDRDEIKEDDWNGLIGSLEIKALGNKLFNIDEIRECLLNKKKVTQDEGQLIGEILWYKKVLYTNGIEWEYFYVDKYSKELKESILKIVNNRIAFEKAEAEKQRYDWWSEFKKIYDKNIIVCNDCITKNCMNDWDDFIDKINKINWK